MSKKVIDLENMVLEDLDEDDLLYLLQRGRVPVPLEHEEAVRAKLDLSSGVPVHQRANTGNANTANETIEELEARLTRMKRDQEAERDDGGPAAAAMRDELAKLDGYQGVAYQEAQYDRDEEHESAYEDGWNNDRRRAELAKRGLSVEGSKAEMIDRLQQNDEEAAEDAAAGDDENGEED